MAGTLVIPDGWEPEFPGQRPPFSEGNKLAVTHGINSPALVGPIAQRYFSELMADDELAILRENRFRNAVNGYCASLAKVEMLEDWVDTMTIQQAADSKQGQTSALELLRKWQATVDTKAARLGLDPASWVKIHATLARARNDDAATTLSALRTQLEAAQRDARARQGDDDADHT